MARVSIIRADNMVVVDGVARKVDLSSLDPAIAAVQWNGKAGHVEYAEEDDKAFRTNSDFADFSVFDWIVTAWEAAVPPVEPEPEPDRRSPLERLADNVGVTVDELVADLNARTKSSDPPLAGP